uniref:Uncharacterized protein n=1 Tax=Desulfovibrio sp. U5L TaxID=596152 RepID=I2Q7R2_9BACT
MIKPCRSIGLEHYLPLFFICAVSIIAYSSIIRSPLFFEDDALRVAINEGVNQGVHGRPFADMIYTFFSGGLFIDISPFSQIVAIFFMILSATILLSGFSIVTEKKFLSLGTLYDSIILSLRDENMWSLALVFVCFPLNFSIISYRFDSLPMCSGILFACSAFTICQTINIHSYNAYDFLVRVLCASVLIFFSLGLYQPTIGFYVAASFILFAHMVLSSCKFIEVLLRVILSVIPLIVGSVFYIPIYLQAKYMAGQQFYSLKEHPYIVAHNNLLPLKNLFEGILKNCLDFINYYLSFLGENTLSYAITSATFIVFVVIFLKSISNFRKIIAIVFLFSAFISCASIQIFLQSPIFATRTSVSLAVFVLGIFFISSNHSRFLWIKKTIGIIRWLIIIISIGILSAIGNAQRDQYRFEQEIVYNGLEADIAFLYEKEGLKSFSITPWALSTCVTTIRVLQNKYPFLRESGSMTVSMFTISKMLSYLPINYVLSENFDPSVNLNVLETVIKKYNYTIKKISDEQYLVVLHPHQTLPFTPDRLK